ncbi:MAG: nucleoside-diphosphate kinase [Phycisphaerae bacterium]|nr:nucleoside-diphosphate kinase [Phycisphaerae bacterium]
MELQRTLILVKPDAVQRQIIGRIISRFEEKGLKIIAAKFMQISPELAAKHYAAHQGKYFYQGLVDFMTSGPVVAMVLQAPRVIEMTRKIMGATFGCDAEGGTIRGDYSASRGLNIVHGSDSPEAAEIEINNFFDPSEILDYDLTINQWIEGKD